MTILSLESKEKDDQRFVGVLLSQQDHSCLTFYALAKGITKSKLFKDLVEIWINKQKTKGIDILLAKEIAKRVYPKWRIRKVQDPTLTFKDFKDMFELELIGRGLEQEYIHLIMKELQEK